MLGLLRKYSFLSYFYPYIIILQLIFDHKLNVCVMKQTTSNIKMAMLCLYMYWLQESLIYAK